jgi:hypothetical protein
VESPEPPTNWEGGIALTIEEFSGDGKGRLEVFDDVDISIVGPVASRVTPRRPVGHIYDGVTANAYRVSQVSSFWIPSTLLLDFADVLVEEGGKLFLPNTTLIAHRLEIHGNLGSNDNLRIGPGGQVDLHGEGGFDDNHLGNFKFDNFSMYGDGRLNLYEIGALNATSFELDAGSKIRSYNSERLGVYVYTEERFSLESGSSWDAVGGGLTESATPFGDCSAPLDGHGGTYGGQGGLSEFLPCGAFDEPFQLGLPGGTSSKNGSRGGGGVFVEGPEGVPVLEVNIDGVIDVSGANGTVNSGGGSGGSVYLHSLELKGDGKIKANGGDSLDTGGGGGGRIALIAEDRLEYVGSTSALGGESDVGGGSAGTVLRREVVSGESLVCIDNENRTLANESLTALSGDLRESYDISKLKLENNARLKWILNESVSKVMLSGSMEITQGSIVNVESAGTIPTAGIHFGDNLVVSSLLTLDNVTQVSAQNISVCGVDTIVDITNALSSIRMEAKKRFEVCSGGSIIGDGGGALSDTALLGCSIPSMGVGGSYGGRAQNGTDPCGSYDGSDLIPGVGGGSHPDSSVGNGGRGGIALEIVANSTGNSVVQVNGTVSVEGSSGTEGGGSGSGGTLTVYSNRFEGASTGILSVRGGASSGSGFAGSGGRLALYMSLSYDYEGSSWSSSGQGGTEMVAGAGTAYWHVGMLDTFNNTKVVIDNNNLLETDDFSDERYSWLSGDCRDVYPINEVLVKGGGRLEFGDALGMSCDPSTTLNGSLKLEDGSQGRWLYEGEGIESQKSFSIRDELLSDGESSLRLENVDRFHFGTGWLNGSSRMFVLNEGKNGTAFIVEESLFVSKGSKIDGDGEGFGSNEANVAAGCMQSGIEGSGGSFGGQGGFGGSWGCGSVDDVFFRGSGGAHGSSSDLKGGAGGNSLWFSVTSPSGWLGLNGEISARGSPGNDSYNFDDRAGGGGSGGSVTVVGNRLFGSGHISCRGGHGGMNVAKSDMSGGGGSGGRIIISSVDSNGLLDNADAYGGKGGDLFELPLNVSLAGAPGTILGNFRNFR